MVRYDLSDSSYFETGADSSLGQMQGPFISAPEKVMLGLGIGLEGHGLGLDLCTHVRLVAGDTHVFEVH